MKILCVRGGGKVLGLEPVAILEEGDLKNFDLLTRLKGLEREYSNAGAFVSKMGMFEIVEMDNNELENVKQTLGGKINLANGLAEYIKIFEKEVSNYARKTYQDQTSYYEEYANQAALDNGYPD